MVDINVLQADLQVLSSIEKSNLARKKMLCDKLNAKKFDEVIHEIFSKDDILKFLSEASIPVGVVTNKDFLEKAAKEAFKTFDQPNFKFLLLDRIDDLGDDSLEVETAKVLEKHGIQFDEEGEDFAPETDPQIVKLFNELSLDPASHIIDETLTITHNCDEIQSPITAEITTSDFDVWVAEHFLVKDVDGQPGMATFELVY